MRVPKRENMDSKQPVIPDRRLELKVKIKSLADEARTIRREQSKLKADGPLKRFSEREGQHTRLHLHRTVSIRDEQRASLLAYAFIRGRAYRTMEPTTRPEKRLQLEWGVGKRALNIAERFGKADAKVSFRDWLTAKV